jgi:hypothetical protein
MPRLGTAHRYALVQRITTDFPKEGRTTAEMGLLWFLRVRELEGGYNGATQDEMTKLSRMSARTVGTAVRGLVKAGIIE